MYADNVLPDKSTFLCSVRWRMCYYVGVAYILLYSHRVNLSMAVVCMVKTQTRDLTHTLHSINQSEEIITHGLRPLTTDYIRNVSAERKAYRADDDILGALKSDETSPSCGSDNNDADAVSRTEHLSRLELVVHSVRPLENHKHIFIN